MNRPQKLLKMIRHTLSHHWDPIGMLAHEGPEDEYHAYADQVMSLLLKRSEPEQVGQYLHQVATERLGLSDFPYERSLQVATELSLGSMKYLNPT